MDETQIVVPGFIAFTLGMIVYFIGASLTRRHAFLRDFNIPEPVSGGIAAALLVWLAYAALGARSTSICAPAIFCWSSSSPPSA